ncbi:energy transducer TonB [Litoribrevibacter euphylliae]|uniref:Energy transducer TonB n=1 Tax=Litoribrevibacter euphylliae TaxID=1834034 RepID=A0ABV7HFE7_9GAMM
MKSFGVRLFSVCMALLLHAGVISYLNSYEQQQVSSGQVSNSTLALSFSFSSPLIERAEASISKPVLIEESTEESIQEPIQKLIDAPIKEPVVDPISKPQLQKAQPAPQVPAIVDSFPQKDTQTTEKVTDVLETEIAAAETESPTIKNDSKTPISEMKETETNEVETESVASQATAISNQSGVHEDIILDPQFKSDPQPPIYPRLARKRGQEGVVWLDVWLDSRGEQTKLEVYDSSGIGSLDRAAIEAVSKWEFVPKHAAGLTVASRVRIPVHFMLN